MVADPALVRKQKAEKAKTLIKAGSPQDAIDLLKTLPMDSRRKPKIQLLVARALLDLGSFERCANALRRADIGGPHEVEVLKLRKTLNARQGDDVAMAETLRRMAALDPENETARLALARARIRLGDAAAARAIAEALIERDPTSPNAHALACEVAIAESDPEAIRAALRDALSHASACPSIRKLHVAVKALPRSEVGDLRAAFLERWSRGDPALEAALEVMTTGFADRTPIEMRNALRQALDGSAESAADALARAIEEIGPVQTATQSERLARVRRLLDVMPAPSSRLRPLVVDDGSEVLASPPGTSGVAVLVFTGLGDGAFLTVEIIDAFLARRGHSALYVRDFSRSLYIGGIASLAPDRQGTIATLKAKALEIGARRLWCLSTSAGGFGAIRYGEPLGAERVICFSPPTCLRPDFLEASDDRRGRILARRLQQTFAEAELDLRPQLAAGAGKVPIDIFYGDGSAPDIAHARHVAGLEGVRLHAVPGHDEHDTMVPVMHSGEFDRLLSR